MPKFKQIIADAAPKGELKSEAKAAEAQFAATMLDILKLSEFEAKDLTWKSFPNHVGHKDFAGCFRCHDGKHVNEKGEAIRLLFPLTISDAVLREGMGLLEQALRA